MNGSPLSFWVFSLSIYGKPGVDAECLDLQASHGIDVNLLLFCAYLGAIHGIAPPASELGQAAALVGPWQKDVVGALRAARRSLKQFAADPTSIGASAATLRETVKAAELEAERIEQSLLQEWAASRLLSLPSVRPAEAIAANIRALFALYAAAGEAPKLPDRLIAAALAAAGVPAI